MEWMDQYRDRPRTSSALTIDKPMILFLGLSIPDFVAGVSVFVGLMIFWDSGWAIPLGLLIGSMVSWCARAYRLKFPPRFLQHVAWSLGQASMGRMPVIFKQRRYVVFGP